MFRGRGALLAVLFLAMSFAAAATAGAQVVRDETDPESTAVTQEAAAAPTVPSDVENATRQLTRPPSAVTLPAIPSDPVNALISAVNAHSRSLGFDGDHGPAIRASGMSPESAGRLALLVQAVVACEAATERQQRLECEVRVNDAAAGVLRAKAPSFGDVRAWPSLFVDGNRTEHVYRHDYSILIDRGGDDTYDNNAGGNLQDITFGPRGSAAPRVGPAIGCEQVQGNFPAPTASGHDCIAAPQVVFIDQKSASTSSNDTYGVFKSPRTGETSTSVPRWARSRSRRASTSSTPRRASAAMAAWESSPTGARTMIPTAKAPKEGRTASRSRKPKPTVSQQLRVSVSSETTAPER